MSDETKQPDISGEWTMPEPVFRSTDGRTPAGIHATVPADESTTAPGFHQATTVETEGLPPESDIHTAITAETEGLPPDEPDFHQAKTIETKVPAPDAQKVKAAPVKSKKGGCAKTFLFTVGLIGLGIAAVVIALVYFLFYYRPAETGTF